jgi:hypothetical protein
MVVLPMITPRSPRFNLPGLPYGSPPPQPSAQPPQLAGTTIFKNLSSVTRIPSGFFAKPQCSYRRRAPSTVDGKIAR